MLVLVRGTIGLLDSKISAPTLTLRTTGWHIMYNYEIVLYFCCSFWVENPELSDIIQKPFVKRLKDPYASNNFPLSPSSMVLNQ